MVSHGFIIKPPQMTAVCVVFLNMASYFLCCCLLLDTKRLDSEIQLNDFTLIVLLFIFLNVSFTATDHQKFISETIFVAQVGRRIYLVRLIGIGVRGA